MIRRGKHKSRYTIVPNLVVEDARLSAGAKGTLCYLISRPAGWSVRHDHLRRTMKLGRKGFATVMGELIAAGYVRRSDDQQRAEDHTFLGYDYDVFDEPQPVDNQGAVVPFPTAGSRQREGDSGNKEGPTNQIITTERTELTYADAAIVEKPQGCPSSDQATPSKIIGGDRGQLELELANRFGADGWSVVFALQPSKVDELCALHRRGALNDAELDRVRASINIVAAMIS